MYNEIAILNTKCVQIVRNRIAHPQCHHSLASAWNHHNFWIVSNEETPQYLDTKYHSSKLKLLHCCLFIKWFIRILFVFRLWLHYSWKCDSLCTSSRNSRFSRHFFLFKSIGLQRVKQSCHLLLLFNEKISADSIKIYQNFYDVFLRK